MIHIGSNIGVQEGQKCIDLGCNRHPRLLEIRHKVEKLCKCLLFRSDWRSNDLDFVLALDEYNLCGIRFNSIYSPRFVLEFSVATEESFLFTTTCNDIEFRREGKGNLVHTLDTFDSLNWTKIWVRRSVNYVSPLFLGNIIHNLLFWDYLSNFIYFAASRLTVNVRI